MVKVKIVDRPVKKELSLKAMARVGAGIWSIWMALPWARASAVQAKLGYPWSNGGNGNTWEVERKEQLAVRDLSYKTADTRLRESKTWVA